MLERLHYLLSLARTPKEFGSTFSVRRELQELQSDIEMLMRLQWYKNTKKKQMNLWVKVARLLESLEQMEREFEPLFSPAETEEEIKSMDPALEELRGLQADVTKTWLRCLRCLRC